MYILGICCYYHDASATLVKDGIVVAAAQEERFSRKKHDTRFPINAITYCLKQQGLTIDDIDHVAFYEKPLLKFERVLHQHLEHFPRSYKTFLSALPSWFNQKLRVIKTLKKKLKYTKDVFFVEHHMAHAASSFLPSPFEKAAILTTDGVGEWATTTWGIGERNQIDLKREIRFPHSLGLLYSTITAYLGFSVNNSEYKVMGLSPYGNMSRETNPHYEQLLKVIDIKEDGSYQLDMNYFIYAYKDRMPGKKLCTLLGGPIRKPESELTQRHKDVAAALQMVCEDVVMKMLNHVHKETQCDNIVLAGGVALNSVCNGKILSQTPFKQIWIQPDAGDGGTSFGAALYAYNSILNRKRVYTMKNSYLGPGFSSAFIKQFLEENNITFTEFASEKELVNTVADLLDNNTVVGWFQGRMEWGPRALGSRSILANPCNPEAKELLNTKVKHREHFRPFAPVVCAEDAPKYFECDKPIPEPTDYMLMVYPVKQKWQSKVPSITHVDGSGRLQTIRREQNKLYYDLVKAFGKLSGIPILINTSFNIRGEPIVCTPRDAYRCMMGTGIDCVIMGNFLVKREDNPQDMWDSEAYAKD